MADPLAEPQPNDISPFLTSFNTVREMLDIGRHYRRNQGRGNTGPGPLDFGDLPPSVRVWVQNNTGAALPSGTSEISVVALSGILGSIADSDSGSHQFARSPAFSGTTPTAITDAFAIIDGPAPYVAGGNSPLVKAVVQGVVPADVDITDAGHNYATPTVSDNKKLTSAASGPARILYKPSGTGVKRCVVSLGESSVTAGAVPNVRLVKSNMTEYSITADTTALATGMSFTIPNDGVYLINTTIVARGVVTGGTGTVGFSNIWAYLNYSGGAGTTVGVPVVCVHGTSGVTVDIHGAATINTVASLLAGTVVEIYGYRDTPWNSGGGQTWSNAKILANPGGGPIGQTTVLMYQQLS